MILYLGTSSLIKLYIEEPDSETVRKWVDEAEIVTTCRVAYAETVAALDIRFKKGDLSAKDYNLAYKFFTGDWSNFAVVDFDDLEAGRLAKKYGLRRLDAIHLSAAILVRKADSSINVSFSSVSDRLCKAAAAEGIRVLPFG